jgi:hypothetical protein
MRVSIEKTFQGAWHISCLFNGFLASRQYIGYTKKEALALFSQDVLGGVPCYA